MLQLRALSVLHDGGLPPPAARPHLQHACRSHVEQLHRRGPGAQHPVRRRSLLHLGRQAQHAAAQGVARRQQQRDGGGAQHGAPPHAQLHVGGEGGPVAGACAAANLRRDSVHLGSGRGSLCLTRLWASRPWPPTRLAITGSSALSFQKYINACKAIVRVVGGVGWGGGGRGRAHQKVADACEEAHGCGHGGIGGQCCGGRMVAKQGSLHCRRDGWSGCSLE